MAEGPHRQSAAEVKLSEDATRSEKPGAVTFLAQTTDDGALAWMDDRERIN